LKVWVLQTGEPLPIDKHSGRGMRAVNLVEALVARGHEVLLWSSDFDHLSKTHRKGSSKRIVISANLEVQLIASPGYSRNIGLSRVRDHVKMARELKSLIAKEPLPDVAFIGFPPIETADVMSKFLAKAGVPTILDVKDAWPEIFVRAIPKSLRACASLITRPMKRSAIGTMRRCTVLCSVSDSFLSWAQKYSAREITSRDFVAPLSSPLGMSDAGKATDAARYWDDLGVRDDEVVRISFVGSLTHSFDFGPLTRLSPSSVQWVICGDGPKLTELVEAFSDRNDVVLPGWIDKEQYVELARRSSVMWAPYKSQPDFEMSIPNKIIDTLCFGLPVLSPLKGETGQLIDDCNVGYRYDDGSAYSLHEQVMKIVEDEPLRASRGTMARELYSERFEFSGVYMNICERIEQLSDAAGWSVVNERDDLRSEKQ
jgi:glycosyltransferase involved in cell wall biosynthesis